MELVASWTLSDAEKNDIIHALGDTASLCPNITEFQVLNSLFPDHNLSVVI